MKNKKNQPDNLQFYKLISMASMSEVYEKSQENYNVRVYKTTYMY